ncbi:actin-like ATPase domain-containing protein, partial [Aureobasidium melanogenum]
MDSPQSVLDMIIVGFDFGTTFSAIGIAYPGSLETALEITVLKDWPGSNGITSEKVPSEIAYELIKQGVKRDSSGEQISGSGPSAHEIKWGFEIGPNDTRLRYLKLRLDERQEYPPSVTKETLDALLEQSGVSTEQAVSDYMSMVFKQAKDAMILKFGEAMVSNTTIKIVLTVPAVWSDAAKDATLRAAERAGLGTNTCMISEPEAASAYAISSINQKQKILSVGDNLIICDCGGGTVDLTSVKIISLSPLQVEESAPGIGALCGGAFLNLRFEDLVRERIGSDDFDSLCRRKPRAWATAHKEFEENVKRNFDPSNSQVEYDKKKFYIPLPGVPDDPAAGIEDGYLALSTGELAEVFRPIVNSVIDLVERQRIILEKYDETAKALILVGGFGQSKYLYKCLKQRFADEDPPPTYTYYADELATQHEGPRFMILQPDNPWTAVVRGAVMSGLGKDLVVSRKARRHYGITVGRTWDPEVHSLKNKYWCDLYGEWRARNQIHWCINTGQSLPVNEPVLFEFSTRWDFEDGYPTSVKPRIIVSDDLDAPDEFEESFETRTLCRLLTSLRNVPRKHFQVRTKNRKKHYKLSYTIGVLVASGSLEFDLRVDGIIYGKVRADYE